MYNKDFGKVGRCELKIVGQTRRCQSCGKSLKKGDYYYGGAGINGTFSSCIDCCGEAFYQAKHVPISELKEAKEEFNVVNLQYKKTQEKRRDLFDIEQELQSKMDHIEELKEKVSKIKESDEDMMLHERVKSIIKDYPSEKIIRTILQYERDKVAGSQEDSEQ